MVGAGSMVGAGVFVVWAPAAQAAGTGLLIALVIAAAVAFANATSSAQLAAAHPESGGTYVYGRRQLSPLWGAVAGWGFVIGKTASCAAMALAVGAYLWPQQERGVALVSTAVIVGVNLLGVSRTVAVTRVLLAVALVALGVVVVSGITADQADLGRLTPIDTRVPGILEAAGLLFFAFAGYARIATLGEEVRDPEVTIPTAIPRALGGVLALYAVVGVVTLAVVPLDSLAATDAPLQLVVDTGRWDGLAPVVRLGAGIASLGVLLNLMLGISRTVLAMARTGDLPSALAHVDERHSVPRRAELLVGVAVVVLVLLVELRDALAVSGVAVLTYYAITNAAALTLGPERRRWPRWLAVFGVAGCVLLVASLPPVAIASGSG